ncbi:MAG: hypothetical protein IKH81_03690 [Clostridia bacterium]|nr:hypothetical protein [Clostridia bacterium]
MKIRPTDVSGDILPVLHISDMSEKAKAVADLIKDRLSVFYGEWWENSNYGFPALKQMQESRLSDSDIRSFSSMITEYIRQTEGVKEVFDVKTNLSNKQLNYSCSVLTVYGVTDIAYQMNV